MFAIAHNDVLRVQVYVPQEYVFGLSNGQDATITVPQLPGKTFHGRVARNAAALASNTRTLLAEVDVDNRDGALSPGLYGIVHLQEPRQEPIVTVPTQAIIFDKNGLSVAVLEDGKIQIRHLDVAADNGATLEIRAGLKSGDQVILSPPRRRRGRHESADELTRRLVRKHWTVDQTGPRIRNHPACE